MAPRYECQNCYRVFYGWGIKSKCSNCGGKLQEVYSDNKKNLAKEKFSKEEFEEMCEKAGVKKEALCKTVFTKNIEKW